MLISYLNKSSGQTRELIARVLGEVASAELGDELMILAADPLAEVRASAARALAAAPPSIALPALTVLVCDDEWFVRLRAVVALGSMEHQGRVRPLIRALCDRNRYVRQRAAWALARLGPQLEDVLEQVVDTRDSYALQAFVSELERSGAIERVIEVLGGSVVGDSSAGNVLLDALNAGRTRVEAALVAAAAAGSR